MNTPAKEQETDEILTPDLLVPIKPRLVVKQQNTKPYKYYRQIRPSLPDWWNEFNGDLNERGAYKYATIKQFIVSRTKSRVEQQWLMQMFGPAPEEEIQVPWLGDWYKRRLNGVWLPEQPAKVEAISQALKQKLQQLEAIQGMRPIVVQIIARHMRWHEQVDAAFGGQSFDSSRAPEAQIARRNEYWGLHNEIDNYTYKAIEMMMKLNGINPEEVNQSIVFNTQVNQQLNTAEQPSVSIKEIETAKLARQLMYHSEKLKLPSVIEKLREKSEKPIEGEVKGERLI